MSYPYSSGMVVLRNGGDANLIKLHPMPQPINPCSDPLVKMELTHIPLRKERFVFFTISELQELRLLIDMALGYNQEDKSH